MLDRFYLLQTKHTTHIAEHLWKYQPDNGTHQSIVLDNSGEFISGEFQQFCRKNRITFYYTTPYHPQDKEVTKRMHRTLKSVLVTLC